MTNIAVAFGVRAPSRGGSASLLVHGVELANNDGVRSSVIGAAESLAAPTAALSWVKLMD